VIQRMTQDLRLPIEIVAAPTRREDNGLAMSSRNRYLSSEERDRAAVISRTLCAMRDGLRDGQSLAEIEADARSALQAAGAIPDYTVIRRAADLSVPDATERIGLIALIAARLSRARLIDNLLLDI